MKKLFLALMLVASATMMTSCKDATVAQFQALSKPHLIKQYGCDGKIINQWRSTGSVSNEQYSDGWYFEDAATGKLTEVTGSIVVTVE